MNDRKIILRGSEHTLAVLLKKIKFKSEYLNNAQEDLGKRYNSLLAGEVTFDEACWLLGILTLLYVANGGVNNESCSSNSGSDRQSSCASKCGQT